MTRTRKNSLPILILFFVPLLFLGSCQTQGTHAEQSVQFYNQGNILRQENRLKEAVLAFEKAIEYRPNFFVAIFNLALTLVEMDREKEALGLLENLRLEDPENLVILRAMAWASWKDGDKEEALAIYQSILTIFEADLIALKGLSVIYESVAQAPLALRYRRRIVELEDNVLTKLDLAKTLVMVGEESEALNLYHEVLFTEPGNVDVLEAAGKLHEKMGEGEETLVLYSALTRLKKEEVEEIWWSMAGLYLIEFADYGKGFQALETAFSLGYPVEESWEKLLDKGASQELKSAIEAIIEEHNRKEREALD